MNFLNAEEYGFNDFVSLAKNSPLFVNKDSLKQIWENSGTNSESRK